MPASSVPELSQKLFQQLGVGQINNRNAKGGGGSGGGGGGRSTSRKDQRKAHRDDKKTRRYTREPVQTQKRVSKTQNRNGTKGKQPTAARPQPQKRLEEAEEDDSDDDELDGLQDDMDDMGSINEFDLDESDVKSEEEAEEDDAAEDSDDTPQTKKLSRADRERLARDDAEIAEYERKLGIKGRKALPKAFKDDGLDDILGEMGGDEDDGSSDDEITTKRKREDDDWLASKRRKAAKVAQKSTNEADESGSDVSGDDFDEGSDDDDMGDLSDAGSFGGFSSDGDGDEDAPAQPKERENPYKAPTTGNIAVKYVPPALRRAAGQGDEAARVRRQVQGLINRLTDDNILSIVQSVREVYDTNARGAVTEAITDAMLDQLCKPENLPDQFFVLSGGFCAALYKVIGSSFGAHVINEVVKLFGKVYEKALAFTDVEGGIPKEPSNIIAFLSQLYTFEVVSSKIIFDYLERMLRNLNEINVELLLRVCRMAGALLRRDDPAALKHVADELNKAVTKAGVDNTSVRTKFMVETINDLKNKKKKARGLDSGVVSEAVQRMKKRLGELKSQNRRLDGLAPMGMSLDDLEGVSTRGKWWLVGASVPVQERKRDKKNDTGNASDDGGLDSDSEDMSIIVPNLGKKAREQSLTTETEVAIFTAVMGAQNVKDGFERFMNLRLKNNDRQQLARVLIQCAGSETEYQGYYAQVAKMASSDGRIRFALKTRLWGIFRSLGEPLFGEAADDDEETIDTARMQDENRLKNVAMFYADLVHEGCLTLEMLKPLDLPTITAWTMKFMNHFVFELLDGCRGKDGKEDAALGKVFGSAKTLPVLAAGLEWLLRERNPLKGRPLGPKKKERMQRVAQKAQVLLQSMAQDG